MPVPFPEFEKEKKKILFFSRGRGRGHAIPDIQIVISLYQLTSDVEVRFVSYGLGAETITAAGYPLIDIGLPDTSPIAEMTALAGKLIAWLDPDLVVAHEEFPVAPVAKIFDKPVVFITDFFAGPDMYSMGALKFADKILFTGREGVFDEPPTAAGKVHYVGPVLRPYACGAKQRQSARSLLGIAEDAFVVSAFPGSWSEAQAPAVELVWRAFSELNRESKRLVWVNGVDSEDIQRRFAGSPDFLVLPFSLDPQQAMCASTVAVTKTNRMAVFELNALRIPVVALSYELNPFDDQGVSGLAGVKRVLARELTSSELCNILREMEQTQVPALPLPALPPSQVCAGLVLQALTQACE